MPENTCNSKLHRVISSNNFANKIFITKKFWAVSSDRTIENLSFSAVATSPYLKGNWKTLKYPVSIKSVVS